MPANSEKVDILVVDDRPDKLLALEAILEPLNENIVKASSGGQALRLLLKHDFAVLLLDVQMPDIDGFQTAELIRQNDRTKNLPILFVSAFDATNDKLRKVYALGAVDYIPTPGAPDALRAKVSVFVELYRKNRALQKLVQESNAKTSQLHEFCYTVAHDLRSPLRAITGFAEILEKDYGKLPDQEAINYLSRIVRSSHRLDRLIEDLLRYCRVEQVDLCPDEVNLAGAIAASLKLLEAQIKEKQAEISVRYPLPTIRSNKGALEHVFLNLLSNALKFSRQEAPLHINIYGEDRNERVRAWIEDNGIGIDPQYHQRIFGMFVKLQNDARDTGTGVGLAIVSKTIERLGGTRGLESDLNKGSRFWIELPKEPTGANKIPVTVSAAE